MNSEHDQELEEYICKYCDNTSSNTDDTLIMPCACTGTQSHVHHDCLKNWIKVSGQGMCTTCGTLYKFKTGITGFIPESVFYIYRKISIVAHVIKACVLMGIILYTYYKTIHQSLINNPFTVYSILICIGIRYGEVMIVVVGIALYYMIRSSDLQYSITQSITTLNKYQYVIDFTTLAYYSYIFAFHISECTFSTYCMLIFLIFSVIDTAAIMLEGYKKRVTNDVILNYSS